MYEYTVTGIVKSPLFISRDKGTSRIGDGSIAYFVIIPEEDFQLDYYTEILATVKGAKALDSYSEAYDQAIDAVKERLEPIAEERETIRYNEIMDEARAELIRAAKSWPTPEKRLRTSFRLLKRS
jgi:putative ABC transport system permease protein